MITTVTLNASIDKAYFMDEAIENGTVMRVARCINTAGGKGLNVARVAHLCGSDVIATGLVGGFNGSYLEAMLKDDGIRSDFYHVKGETRSCINILDPKYGSTEYLEPGCEVEPEETAEFLDKVFPKVIAGSDVVTISGSVPKGMDKHIYENLVARIKAAGKTAVLDTSGELLKNGLAAKPDMVKPNRDELEALFGTKIGSMEDVIALGRKIYDMGIANVVISLGGDGAMLICSDGVFQGKSPKLDVVNTVGCGDSMVGAFAVGLERKMPPQEVLRYAVSVASANAMSPHTGDFEPAVQKDIYEKTAEEKIG